MKQLAIGLLLSYIGIAMCYSSDQLRDKRQTTNTDSILDCVASVAGVHCTSGLNQALVNIYAQCGHDESASTAAKVCVSNEKGELCAAKITGAINILTNAIRDCEADVSQGTTCSSMCSTALQSLRNNLGCCVSIFNQSSYLPLAALSRFKTLFSSSLWARCTVNTVSECPYVPTFTPVVRDTPCYHTELPQNLLSYQCTQVNVQSYLNALSGNSNCQFLLTDFVSMCDQRSNGDYCAVGAIANPGKAYLRSIYSACNEFLTTRLCPSFQCYTAVQQFRDSAGCCFHKLYNSSTGLSPAISLATSSSLWNACGVSSPGVCTSSLTPGIASTVKATGSTVKGFDAIIVFLVAAVVKLIFC